MAAPNDFNNPYRASETSSQPSASSIPGVVAAMAFDRRIILSIMMFLQFAIWGSWVIVYYPFLIHKGFTPVEATSLNANMYLGAIISTLFAGYLADRWINSERLMGICHVLGAGMLYLMSQFTTRDDYWTLFVVTFCYSLIFNPTLAVINSLTFRNVPDGERDFPGLRVLGTIGWICAGLLIDRLFTGSVIGADGKEVPNTIATNGPLIQASIISLIFGVYCFLFLPKNFPYKLVFLPHFFRVCHLCHSLLLHHFHQY